MLLDRQGVIKKEGRASILDSISACTFANPIVASEDRYGIKIALLLVNFL